MGRGEGGFFVGVSIINKRLWPKKFDEPNFSYFSFYKNKQKFDLKRKSKTKLCEYSVGIFPEE